MRRDEIRGAVKAVALLILLWGGVALAGALVDQGSGNPNVNEWTVTTAARRAGKTTEVLVTNGAGGTAMPTTPFAQRKSVELQNLGPNPIYCTVDGTAPVVSKARQVAAVGGSWATDVGPNVVITCIASTAAQLTTAATIVSEIR